MAARARLRHAGAAEAPAAAMAAAATIAVAAATIDVDGCSDRSLGPDFSDENLEPDPSDANPEPDFSDSGSGRSRYNILKAVSTACKISKWPLPQEIRTLEIGPSTNGARALGPWPTCRGVLVPWSAGPGP